MTTRLLPLAFVPLMTGEVKPRGWLLNQLHIQADGLSGHLDEFWPDIRDSRWFGGAAEGWERAPYWLDGFIPLAFLLDDKRLIAKAQRYIGEILTRQQPEGWLGPVAAHAETGKSEIPAGYDLWAELLVFKVLVEAHRATQDPGVLDALELGLTYFDRLIDSHPLANWGQSRWFEGLVAIFYLYDIRSHSWLLDLAVKIQAQGFHWGDFFTRWPCEAPTPEGRWSYMSHVVNNAMAVKAHGLWMRMSGDPQDGEIARGMIKKLQSHHGMVTGVFSGDECLAGTSPLQGTELCAVVEYAYSLECLLSLLGDVEIADRLEQIVFNALPATFSPDMWTHQYDQQVNQVECTIHPRAWKTNGPEANLFGLEPNFGCCTANLSQGWPKYAANLWMRTPDGGLAALSYAPCVVETTLEGGRVVVEVESEYPFKDTISIHIKAENAGTFPVLLRIPYWTKDATLRVDGRLQPVESGGFARIVLKRSEEHLLELCLPMKPRLVPSLRAGAAVTFGPLVMALKIEEDWRRIHADLPQRELPHADYEVYARSAWNYALAVDPERIEEQFLISRHPVGGCPFSPEGAPLSVKVWGRIQPEWGMENGSAGEIPLAPANSDRPLEEITLIPYGCTNLRIGLFPILPD